MKYLLALPAGLIGGMILRRSYLAGRHQTAITLVLVAAVTIILLIVILSVANWLSGRQARRMRMSTNAACGEWKRDERKVAK